MIEHYLNDKLEDFIPGFSLATLIRHFMYVNFLSLNRIQLKDNDSSLT